MADLVNLMNHTRPYVRKKAALCMYKLYVKYPQGLRLTFDKLKERLDDHEPSVVSTAVNVICELSNKNPRNYLAMAPKFFRLLTTSSNNWMLIKVVKLLGSLVSEEPRLARKMLEPLATIIQHTGAKSLQYECINTVTEALPYTKREDGTDAKNAPAVIKLCSDYLRDFIEDQDQNLKYLGLVGLVNLMKSSPRSVVDHRELVLKCLNDDDITIRSRALELLAGIVSRKSLVDLVHHLLEHVKHSEGNYRDEIISKVLYMCSKEKFALVTDFAWYTSILLHLATMQGAKHGKEVADQLIEIALRVDLVRPYAVESMLSMLLDDSLILGQARTTVSEVLKAAAWIIGEYSQIVSSIANDIKGDDDDDGYWIEGPTGEDIRSVWRGQKLHVKVIDALLHPRATNLPPHVQSAFVQSALKIFVRSCQDCNEADIGDVIGVLRSRLGVFLQSLNIEVQERASTLRYLLADFDILSMNWQAAAEEMKQEEENKPKSLIEDLLDLPVYTPGSVKAVDETGARAAMSKKRVLAAIVGEKFYAVHSKAQKRVPVPEGLDLEKPFSSSALSKLMAIEIPENLSLATLLLTNIPTPVYPERRDDERVGHFAKSSFSNEDYNKDYGANEFTKSFQNSESSTVARRPEDEMFYLSGNTKQADIIPLSQILAETFEDKKGKKGKKEKKGRKIKSDEIDTREMLPAGAMDSDDENELKKTSKKEKVTPKRNKGEDLSSIDITAPLRQDEMLPVHKHREVVYSAPSSSDPNVESKVKKDKKGKKEKKEKDDGEKDKKKKDKDSPKKAKKSSRREGYDNVGGSGMDDLLNLDWGGGSVPVAAPSAATNPPVASNSSTVKSKEVKVKKGHLWQFLQRVKNVDVFYSASITGSAVNVSVKAVNESTDGSSISVDIVINGVGNIRPSSSSPVRIANRVAPGADGQGVVTLQLDGSLNNSIQLSCNISMSVETLLGPESSTATGIIKIPICASFTPHKVDDSGFAMLIGKSSSKWASASSKVSSTSKAKTALKAIGAFLRAHTVEEEATKAVSLCSKSSNGGFVCCLAKCKGKDDSISISIEIKCLCGSKEESQQLASSIAEALNNLTI